MRRWFVWVLLPVLAVALAACGAPDAQRPTAGGQVRQGVRIDGIALGGMTRADVERVLLGLAEQVNRPAVDAQVDPNTRGLLPGTDGAALDIPSTLQRLLTARAGATVQPVMLPVPPRVTLADLPPAPIYRAPRTRQAVALVLNIAWGTESVPGVLDALTGAHADATFCLVGRWAEQNSALVIHIVNSGKEAGTPYAFCNHGYRDHGWALLNRSQALSSIEQADRAIAALTGTTPKYFSPHKGEFNAAVLEASRQAGHELILWSLDTIDWQHPSPSAIRQRILSRVQPGDIILMHPTVETEQALPGMIAGIRAKGLQLVTLNQLLSTQWPPSGTAANAPTAKG